MQTKYFGVPVIAILSFVPCLQAKNTIDVFSQKNKPKFVSAILNLTPYAHQFPTIITNNEWKELHLDQLLTVLDRTQTGFGSWGLKKLLHPIADQDELQRRQEIITLLIEDDQLFNKLARLLRGIHKTEEALLAYWHIHDNVSRNAEGLYYTIPKLKEFLNDHSITLEGGVVIELARSCSSLLTMLCLDGLQREVSRWLLVDKHKFDLSGGIMSGLQDPLKQHSFSLDVLLKEKKEFNFKTYMRCFAYGSLGDRYKVLREGYNFDPDTFKTPVVKSVVELFPSNSAKLSMLPAAVLALVPTIMYDIKWANDIRYVTNRLFFVHNTLNGLQHRLVKVARFFDVLGVIKNELSAFEELFYPITQGFELGKTKKNISNCIDLLKSRTFTKNRSYFYSRGSVLRTHKVLNEVKKDVVPALHALALLDAYYSIAKLVKEYRDQAVSFTFPTFINQSKPMLVYDDAWIPLLSPEKVATNSVYYGIDGHPLKVVITGPNGCGKSTFLKMIGHMVILAQSWGIAPAQNARLSVFTGIRTGLNPREDLQHGISTFMAEKQRMNELYKFINGAHEDGHRLVLIDEPYRGTVEAESARRIYLFGFDIATTPSIVVMATHVQRPIDLAKDTNGQFDNYHVEILEPTPGAFKRTFKIKSGPAMWWFENSERRARFIDWIG